MFSNVIMWIAIAVLLIWVFIWKFTGLGDGRRYGNKLAEHLGWKKGFFHSVLDGGVDGPSLVLLKALGGSGLTEDQALVELSPSLDRGLKVLEFKFGPQTMIREAKPVVERYLSEWEKKHS
jgi:hypothetical protein